MKATLKGKIQSVSKADGVAHVTISTIGKIATPKIFAQEIKMSGSIEMKGVIADEMKIGATITITISDEEPDERII